ncbi:MAG: 2-phosphosulfolactate phosphatase [Elusimicrobiales bacterium]|nr:2-phosphosulfolactate phosphatase [Elusimicrobiales bacterium]
MNTLNIDIAKNQYDVKNFKGIAIVIDFFRFSSTVVALLQRGKRIKVFSDEKIALDFYKANNNYDFFSERKIDIKKYDNSPYLAMTEDIKNDVIVLTNSGSKAVNACINASVIIIATLSNIESVKRYLSSKTDDVLIVPAYIFYDITNSEDQIVAKHIADYLLSDSKIDMNALKNEIEKTGRIDFLRRERDTADKDLEIIFSLNKFKVVPIANIRGSYADVRDAVKKETL